MFGFRLVVVYSMSRVPAAPVLALPEQRKTVVEE